MPQWQCETDLISERTSYLNVPHRQLPKYGGGGIESMVMGIHEVRFKRLILPWLWD